jgi:hypothetical protein
MKLPVKMTDDGESPLWHDADGKYISYEEITELLNSSMSHERSIFEAWIHAYTSLGCDRESAERMVRAEIANAQASPSDMRPAKNCPEFGPSKGNDCRWPACACEREPGVAPASATRRSDG